MNKSDLDNFAVVLLIYLILFMLVSFLNLICAIGKAFN